MASNSSSVPATPTKPGGADRRASIASSRPHVDSMSHSTPALDNSNNYRHSHDESTSSSSPASHFFTSFISAAQNAASSLTGLKNTNNSTHSNENRQRSMSDPSFFQQYDQDENPQSDEIQDDGGNNDSSHGHHSSSGVNDVVIEPIRTAISTLGKGELSLASLGFSPESAEEQQQQAQSSEATTDTGDANSSGQYNSNDITNSTPSAAIGKEDGDEEVDDEASIVSGETTTKKGGDVTSDSLGQEFNQGGALAVPIMSRSKSRASSLISRQRKQRTTSTFDVNNTNGNGEEDYEDDEDEEDDENAPKRTSNRITGFAYASKKRNKDFHRLFRSVTLDDYLLDDFSCALSREILIHGRLYVSERHVCFNSNILGWVTNLIIGFDEIVTMEKKNTAGLFPNGIIIQTLHARNSFASFVSRDTTLEFLTAVWKQASPHQLRLEAGNSVVHLASDDIDGIKSTSDDDYDEDDDDDDDGDDDDGANNNNKSNISDNSELDLDDVSHDESDSASLGSFGSTTGSMTSDDYLDDDEDDENENENNNNSGQKDASQGESGQKSEDGSPKPGGVESQNSNQQEDNKASASPSTSSSWPVANIGPETHPPSDVGDPESKGEKLLSTETLNAPLGVIVNLLFGEDVSFMKRLIVDVGKNTNLSDYQAFGKEKTRKYEYIKPLNGPVGPKQTKCICTDTVEEWDLDKRIIVVTSTSTPDVPSGGSFVTKTRYTLGWDENNKTKLLFSYWTEWSGKSWIKSAIERGSQEGQSQFAKDLIREINNSLKAAAKGKKRPSVSGKPDKKSTKSAKKARRQKKKEANEAALKAKSINEPDENTATGIVKRLGEIMNTEISSTLPIPVWGIVIIILIVYILMSRSGSAPAPTKFTSSTKQQEKMSQMMLEEEYEVWRWIDDRINHKGIEDPPNTNKNAYNSEKLTSQELEEAYGKQELAESIRITQQRLNILKDKLEI